MTAGPPSIDEILRQFFGQRLASVAGLRRRRIEDVAHRLWYCLECEGPALVGEEERVLLELEREFTAEGAFVASMTAPQLLPVLLRFVTEAWLPEDSEDRRVQLRTTDALVDFLLVHRLIDRRRLALPVLQVQVAIIEAKAGIR